MCKLQLYATVQLRNGTGVSRANLLITAGSIITVFHSLFTFWLLLCPVRMAHFGMVSHRGNVRGPYNHNILAHHVTSLMRRNRARRLCRDDSAVAAINQRPVQRVTQPLPENRRAGLWMLGKQSEVVFNSLNLRSNVRDKVRQDIQAIIADDSATSRHFWNKAPPEVVYEPDSLHNVQHANGELKDRRPPQKISDRNSWGLRFNNAGANVTTLSEASSTMHSDLSTSNYLDSAASPCERNPICQDLQPFPRDAPTAEVAREVLSALPRLTLRNDGSATHGTAVVKLLANDLRRQGIRNAVHDRQCFDSPEMDSRSQTWLDILANSSPLETIGELGESDLHPPFEFWNTDNTKDLSASGFGSPSTDNSYAQLQRFDTACNSGADLFKPPSWDITTDEGAVFDWSNNLRNTCGADTSAGKYGTARFEKSQDVEFCFLNDNDCTQEIVGLPMIALPSTVLFSSPELQRTPCVETPIDITNRSFPDASYFSMDESFHPEGQDASQFLDSMCNNREKSFCLF